MKGSDLHADLAATMQDSADIQADCVHDLSADQRLPSLPRQAEPLSLSTLPFELRQHIYNYIFTHHSATPLSRFPYADFKHTGCRCGEDLSLVSRLFYTETRHLFYKHACFPFQTLISCNRFLDGIGPHIKHIGALSFTFEYSEIYLLQSIFKKFPPDSSLRTLHLEYTSQLVRPGPGPIYLPSVQKRDDTILYDVRFRPEIHPLSKLSGLRKVTVVGDVESEEVQEAVVKLGLKIEEAARKDGVRAKKVEISEVTIFGKKQMLFSIEHLSPSTG